MNNSTVSPKQKPTPCLELKGLRKVFRQGGRDLVILDNIDLKIQAGEELAILGTSGSGKSTLLQIAGLLEKPSSGDVLIYGENSWHLSDPKRCYIRQHHLGFVYQFHHLLPEFTALENVMMPLIIRGEPLSAAKETARLALKKLKLDARADHRPSQLSGGEQQRVAILRALVTKPDVLLADEPTGNLDHLTAQSVFKEFIDLVQDNKSALVMVTHDRDLAGCFKQQLTIQDGKIHPFTSLTA